MRSHTDRRSFLRLLSLLPLVPLLSDCAHPVERASDPAQNREAPSVLILVFDTFSARHASLHGYRRETTPNLARFAERCTVFHRHYATGNFTTPGTASLLTGAYPWSHRALNFLGKTTKYYDDKNMFSLFAERGYETLAYTHNPLVYVLLHQFRGGLSFLKPMGDLCRGGHPISEQIFPADFDVAINSEWLGLRDGRLSHAPSSLFLSLIDRVQRDRLTTQTLRKELTDLFPRGLQSNFSPFGRSLYFILEDAIDWLSADLSTAHKPFLRYIHLYPPHEPYHPRREFVGIFDDGWEPPAKPPHLLTQGRSSKFLGKAWREYDEHITYADAEFGRLYDSIEQSGLLDNSYVVVTSDHGQLFERGIHGHWTEALFEAVIRVPLLISAPGQHQRVNVYATTSCVDVLPTLLHLTGHPIPSWCEGQVLPTFVDNRAVNQRSIFTVEAKSNPKQAPLTKGTIALIKDRYKLIHYFGYAGHESEFELYDLGKDPEELEDLYLSKRSVATDLQEELLRKLHEVNSQTSSSS